MMEVIFQNSSIFYFKFVITLIFRVFLCFDSSYTRSNDSRPSQVEVCYQAEPSIYREASLNVP